LRDTCAGCAGVHGQQAKSVCRFVDTGIDHRALFQRFRPALRRRLGHDVEGFRLSKDWPRNKQTKHLRCEYGENDFRYFHIFFTG
jgi:hypothetical protein